MNVVVSPPPGGTRALLQSLVPSLVPSERRVAQVCIDDPQLVAQMSVADLAERAEVSPATVVRACKSLGFSGFQHLRALLVRDAALIHVTGDGDRDPVDVPGTPRHLVEQLFERAIQGIRGALGALDFEAFDASVEAIRGCGRLLVVGNGASLAAAQSVALHFLGSGRVCESPVDIVTQHISARLLRPGDVCLAVSDSGMNHFTIRSAMLAAQNGATVIAITSYAKSELAGVATHTLVAGADFHSWNDSTVTGNIVQLLLLSALHAAALEGGAEEVAARASTLDEVSSITEAAKQSGWGSPVY